MKKLNFKKKIKLLNYKNFQNEKLDNKSINLINIKFKQKKAFEKISSKSNKFIEKSFLMAFKILREKKVYKFINGPISKKTFLRGCLISRLSYLYPIYDVVLLHQ